MMQNFQKKAVQHDYNLENLLVKGLETYNANIGNSVVDKFFCYMEILKEWNVKINLTAIKEDREIIIKHFIDSVSILPFINGNYVRPVDGNTFRSFPADRHQYGGNGIMPSNAVQLTGNPMPAGMKIIDIGTGAGFPGIPLKIVSDCISVTLLDSLEKRIVFLNEVIGLLQLGGMNTVHGRAEDCGAVQEFREKYDICVARAVAGMPVLLEYCLPFVRPGGIFIAMKGRDIEKFGESKKALEILGGEIEEIKSIVLPFSDINRNIIIVRKLRQTPTKFPRKAGKPSKEPLVQAIKM